MMMIGKGTLKKKIAMKAMRRQRDHDPVAQRAFADADHRLITIASTAAFSPKNSASTKPTLP
jgi:hypothetical protein